MEVGTDDDVVVVLDAPVRRTALAGDAEESRRDRWRCLASAEKESRAPWGRFQQSGAYVMGEIFDGVYDFFERWRNTY